MLIFAEHYWNIYPKFNIGQKNNVYLKFSSTWQELDSVWERLYVENIHADILKEHGTFTVRFSCNTELQIQKTRKYGKQSNEKTTAGAAVFLRISRKQNDKQIRDVRQQRKSREVGVDREACLSVVPTAGAERSVRGCGWLLRL